MFFHDDQIPTIIDLESLSLSLSLSLLFLYFPALSWEGGKPNIHPPLYKPPNKKISLLYLSLPPCDTVINHALKFYQNDFLRPTLLHSQFPTVLFINLWISPPFKTSNLFISIYDSLLPSQLRSSRKYQQDLTLLWYPCSYTTTSWVASYFHFSH
jgi:hypothetical protein